MPAESNHPSPPSIASILDQLACPVCFSPLALGDNALTCIGCRRMYLIIDGIPVLIPAQDNPALL